MKKEELVEKINQSQDKLAIFKDDTNFTNCENLTYSDLKNLITKFLTDEEKFELLKIDFYKTQSKLLDFISKSITNDEVKLNIFKENDIANCFNKSNLYNIARNMQNNYKLSLIKEECIDLNQMLSSFYIVNLIKSLDETSLTQIIYDKNLCINKLQIDEGNIKYIIESINDENKKLELISLYQIKKAKSILLTFSDESKIAIIKENKFDLSHDNIVDILSSLDVSTLQSFIQNNKEFLKDNNIEPYLITAKLDTQKQLDFFNSINAINLTDEERNKILVTLSQETKDSIDKNNIDSNIASILNIEYEKGQVKVDFDGNYEKYRGLDDLISINPRALSDEEKAKLYDLIKVCPNISIKDNLARSSSSTTEFANAEQWIEEIIDKIDDSWSSVEKIAYIDNAIGKKISYAPDYETEVYDAWDVRSLWKIIDKGYGVCNGISQVEQYMLDKIGIYSEMISTGRHAFLKIPNLSVKNANGEIITGDTILDPTWNLSEQRYGAMPENFLRSYEEIRKHDIRKKDGKDVECHKNDEKLSSCNLDLDEDTLREVYKNIRIADENGEFPIGKLIDKSEEINNLNLDTSETIKKQLELLKETNPNFASCPDSTIEVLKDVLLDKDKIDYSKCIIDRVYNKNDDSRKPVQYIYVELPNGKNTFYYADLSATDFSEISKEEFEAKFECYDTDLEKNNNNRPWQQKSDYEKEEDLTKSSGHIKASKKPNEEEIEL